MTDVQTAPAEVAPKRRLGDPITVKLSRPLKTHQGELNELTLRVTPFTVIRKYAPLSSQIFHGTGANRSVEYRINYDTVFSYLKEATGIDDIILGGLLHSDVEAVANAFVTMGLDDPNG